MWSPQLITPAVLPAISEEMARAHSRLDPSVPSADLAPKIAAAVEACEGYTGRQLITATWELWLDRWDEPGISRCGYIRLPRPPLRAVNSIKYLDQDGVEQTLDPSLYQVVGASSTPYSKVARALVFPAYGTVWPANRVQPASIKINFGAGYGSTPATVPNELVAGMLLWFGELYERREQQTVGAVVSANRLAAEDCWHPYRVDF